MMSPRDKQVLAKMRDILLEFGLALKQQRQGETYQFVLEPYVLASLTGRDADPLQSPVFQLLGFNSSAVCDIRLSYSVRQLLAKQVWKVTGTRVHHRNRWTWNCTGAHTEVSLT